MIVDGWVLGWGAMQGAMQERDSKPNIPDIITLGEEGQKRSLYLGSEPLLNTKSELGFILPGKKGIDGVSV